MNEQCAGTQPFDASAGRTAPTTAASPASPIANQAFWNADWIGAHTWNAAGTFVSGSNSFKVGYQGAYHADNRTQEGGTNDLTYRFNEGIPNQLTERLEPFNVLARPLQRALRSGQMDPRPDDLEGALRYDHSWSFYPEQ